MSHLRGGGDWITPNVCGIEENNKIICTSNLFPITLFKGYNGIKGVKLYYYLFNKLENQTNNVDGDVYIQIDENIVNINGYTYNTAFYNGVKAISLHFKTNMIIFLTQEGELAVNNTSSSGGGGH